MIHVFWLMISIKLIKQWFLEIGWVKTDDFWSTVPHRWNGHFGWDTIWPMSKWTFQIFQELQCFFFELPMKLQLGMIWFWGSLLGIGFPKCKFWILGVSKACNRLAICTSLCLFHLIVTNKATTTLQLCLWVWSCSCKQCLNDSASDDFCDNCVILSLLSYGKYRYYHR